MSSTTVPGVIVSHTGQPGALTSVFMRGANSMHTLVLVDGVRVNNAFNGRFDFVDLTVDNVERIEVVRGPQSTRYGSDALGGVINIVTKTRRRRAHRRGARRGGQQRERARARLGGGERRHAGRVGGGQSLRHRQRAAERRSTTVTGGSFGATWQALERAGGRPHRFAPHLARPERRTTASRTTRTI